LDDAGAMPRFVEWGVALRCSLLRLPYGDQGLLISKRLYRDIGGFGEMPLMEDVDLVRRLGRRRIVMLRTPAVTSAERFQKSGYLTRPIRNLFCLALYYLKLPPQLIARIYR
ncbi:MAG: glycosyl transferase family 2, partial [Proteobacteria bacterium]|nr:glycosyl transferase family 2 [Pseudomonadota bacterium]